jgi:hypothetical protein
MLMGAFAEDERTIANKLERESKVVYQTTIPYITPREIAY